MLRDTAVQTIAYRLGNRTDLNARIISEMQLVQTRLEQAAVLPWFLDFLKDDISVAQGDTSFVVPTDFLRLPDEDSGIWVVDDDGNPQELKRDSLSRNRRLIFDTTRDALPVRYTLLGDRVYLFPAADAARTVHMLYSAADDVLSVNIENGWLKHAPDLIIAETCKVIAIQLQMAGMVSVFEKEVGIASDRLWRAHEAQRAADRDYSAGQDE